MICKMKEQQELSSHNHFVSPEKSLGECHLHFGVRAVLEEGADEGLVAVLGRHVDRRLAAVVR